MEPGGHRGRRGLPLDLLGTVVRAGLDAFGLEKARVETVPVPDRRLEARSARQTLFSRLLRFETRGDCLVIAHFDQGSFLPELHIPHISPVGGFDPAAAAVTLLDVDPSQPRPYAVSLDRFWKGISFDYHGLFLPYGYGRGGYVFIQV
jgi:hypothetical protein